MENQIAEIQDIVLCLAFIEVRNKVLFFLMSKFSMRKGKSLQYTNVSGGNSHFVFEARYL